MDSDQLIDLVHGYTDRINLLERELNDAKQLVCRVVAAAGGRVIVPDDLFLKDYLLVEYETPDHRTILAAKEKKNGSQA